MTPARLNLAGLEPKALGPAGEAVSSPGAPGWMPAGPLADQGDLGVAGEPGALVVPAGTSLVAASPVRPVFGEAGPGGLHGEQAGDLRDGQWGHPGVGGRRLIRVHWRRRLGIGAVAQQGGGDGADR
jgi:hypothetical protein